MGVSFAGCRRVPAVAVAVLCSLLAAPSALHSGESVRHVADAGRPLDALIFQDGFENGDAGAWSATVGFTPDLGCLEDGRRCLSAGDCCSSFCDASGACSSAGLCAPIDASCGSDRECCSDLCNGTICEDPGSPAGCQPAGEICASNGECCSGSCGSTATGRCDHLPFCRPSGEVCAAPDDCCSSRCEEVGVTGVSKCVALQDPIFHDGLGCDAAGEVCSSNSDCCSQLCRTDPGGWTKRCQLGGGCVMDGDVCRRDAQCCSGHCSVSAVDGVQRCEPYTLSSTCIPAGDPCPGDSKLCCGYDPGLLILKVCYDESMGTDAYRSHDSEADDSTNCAALGDPSALAGDCCPDPGGGSVYSRPGPDGQLACTPYCAADGEVCTMSEDCCDLNAVCAPFGGFGICVVTDP